MGGSGNDKLFGEGDNDTLGGGSGNDLHVGGDGNDKLTAGSGASVLIGGKGRDTLIGGSSDDLMIAGHTVFDDANVDENLMAMMGILAEWSRSGSNTYESRLDHLRNGGGLNGSAKLKANVTVHDDYLKGHSGRDWLFARTVQGDARPSRMMGRFEEALDEI